jgi:hypothetical protein
MRLKDFANAPGRVYRREACESDGVAGVGIAGEHAQNVTVVVKFDPGQAALETKPFSSVEFDSRGELFVARSRFSADSLLHPRGLKSGAWWRDRPKTAVWEGERPREP